MSESIAREQVDRRVLLVEDEPRMRDMLTRATRDMEFEPTAVGTAEAGLAALEHDPFGIVVADLNLPGMQGMEMCGHIRRRWPQTQLIILTGFGDLDAARNAIRLDVADFLTKPCGLDELEGALDRALRRRRAGIVTLSPAAMPDFFRCVCASMCGVGHCCFGLRLLSGTSNSYTRAVMP